MSYHKKLISNDLILIAEDDEEDRMLQKEAFEDSGINERIVFVHDGEELMEYMNNSLEEGRNLPKLILLDLNMPRKNGKEVLKELKQHPVLKVIPVVILTTSSAPDDIKQTYQDGVNSYITKPSNFSEMVKLFKTLEKYWFSLVTQVETV